MADIAVSGSLKQCRFVFAGSSVCAVRPLHECERAGLLDNEAIRGGPRAVDDAENHTNHVRFSSSL